LICARGWRRRPKKRGKKDVDQKKASHRWRSTKTKNHEEKNKKAYSRGANGASNSGKGDGKGEKKGWDNAICRPISVGYWKKGKIRESLPQTSREKKKKRRRRRGGGSRYPFRYDDRFEEIKKARRKQG